MPDRTGAGRLRGVRDDVTSIIVAPVIDLADKRCETVKTKKSSRELIYHCRDKFELRAVTV